ncbi:MAG: transglutaminase family protein [Planctomycetes bacterium]|nr:transglutaminase family protein [Planctomycetota bacterium]
MSEFLLGPDGPEEGSATYYVEKGVADFRNGDVENAILAAQQAFMIDRRAEGVESLLRTLADHFFGTAKNSPESRDMVDAALLYGMLAEIVPESTIYLEKWTTCAVMALLFTKDESLHFQMSVEVSNALEILGKKIESESESGIDTAEVDIIENRLEELGYAPPSYRSRIFDAHAAPPGVTDQSVASVADLRWFNRAQTYYALARRIVAGVYSDRDRVAEIFDFVADNFVVTETDPQSHENASFPANTLFKGEGSPRQIAWMFIALLRQLGYHGFLIEPGDPEQGSGFVYVHLSDGPMCFDVETGLAMTHAAPEAKCLSYAEGTQENSLGLYEVLWPRSMPQAAQGLEFRCGWQMIFRITEVIGEREDGLHVRGEIISKTRIERHEHKDDDGENSEEHQQHQDRYRYFREIAGIFFSENVKYLTALELSDPFLKPDRSEWSDTERLLPLESWKGVLAGAKLLVAADPRSYSPRFRSLDDLVGRVLASREAPKFYFDLQGELEETVCAGTLVDKFPSGTTIQSVTVDIWDLPLLRQKFLDEVGGNSTEQRNLAQFSQVTTELGAARNYEIRHGDWNSAMHYYLDRIKEMDTGEYPEKIEVSAELSKRYQRRIEFFFMRILLSGGYYQQAWTLAGKIRDNLVNDKGPWWDQNLITAIQIRAELRASPLPELADAMVTERKTRALLLSSGEIVAQK